MRFRRIRSDGALAHQRLDGDLWVTDEHLQPLGASPFTPAFELDAAERAGVAEGGVALPFQPLSFRDFMLFEEHNVAASRGLVERFHPLQHRATAAYERLSRRDFPAFRPHRLFHEQPLYYLGNHATVVPSGTAVAPPAYTAALDFELELGFVLARSLRDAEPAEAESAVGAFVVLNDFSARDVQRREMASGFGPQKSKHFLTSLSGTAVTAEEVLPRLESLIGRVVINGDVISEVGTGGMRWSVGECLAHASRGETLLPGELFATGTLVGGSGMEVGRWLRPGDELSLEIEGVGRIEHAIV